jgi:hypothetical protein
MGNHVHDFMPFLYLKDGNGQFNKLVEFAFHFPCHQIVLELFCGQGQLLVKELHIKIN